MYPFETLKSLIMRLNLPLRYILNPATVLLLSVLMSAIAWSIPTFGTLHKGFKYQADLSFYSLLIIFCWYTCIFTCFYFGQKIGTWISRIIHIKSNMYDIDDPKYIYIFSVATVIGISITYYKILSQISLVTAVNYVMIYQANRLKESLYDNYSAGIMSLRYLIVFSASLAARRYIIYKKLSFMILLNIILLLLTALLSSRLLFIATLLNIIFITCYYKSHIQLKIVKGIAFLMIVFTVLSIFNFTRNAKYYDARDLSFWGAGVSEIIAYLGAPFQVSIGGAESIENVTNVPSETYRNYVDVERNLNTNSAFIYLHELLGYLAWPYIAVLALFMGFLFSFFVGFGNTIFMLPAAAILYAAAELWRLDLFQQGIFITWIFCSISLPIIANSFCYLNKFMAKLR
jgi:hypothetical protein